MSIGARRLSRRSPSAPDGSTNNLLIGKVFSSSVADSTGQPGYPVTNITDQDASTRWISEPTSPVTLTVDLEAVYDLSKLTIVWAGDTIKNFTLSVSTDTSNWTTIYTGTTNNSPTQSVDYTSFSNTARGQYVRIIGTDRWNSSYGNSIWEVMAYGSYVSGPTASGSISSFTAVAASSSAINLSWAYSGSTLSSVIVKRGSTTVATLSGSARSYQDTGLSASTSYTYTVHGVYQLNGASTNTPSASATTGSAGSSTLDSGLVFKSAIYGSYDTSWLSNYENWRGAEGDLHTVFTTNDTSNNGGNPVTWSVILNNWWDVRVRPSQRLQVAIPLWAQSGSGSSVSDNNNSYWVQLANMLQDGDDIRPGWEMNLSGWYWSINSGNKSAWFAAWQRMYTTIKATNPNINVTLCLNEGPSQTSVTNQEIHDNCIDYCDTVGLDFYWWWFGTGETPPGDAEWADKVSQDGGLNWWLPKVIAKGKTIAIPEWGIAEPGSNGYGDQKYPITKYYEWLRANVAHIEYESYFNEASWGGFRLYPNDINPLAAAEYQRQIGLSKA